MTDRDRFDTMMEPNVEGLLERAGSKFSLVTLSAGRARQINRYYGQLGDGSGTIIPPQITSGAAKSLTVAFEEIAADKIVRRVVSDEEAAESADD